jgi:hypothetical protein
MTHKDKSGFIAFNFLGGILTQKKISVAQAPSLLPKVLADLLREPTKQFHANLKNCLTSAFVRSRNHLASTLEHLYQVDLAFHSARGSC